MLIKTHIKICSKISKLHWKITFGTYQVYAYTTWYVHMYTWYMYITTFDIHYVVANFSWTFNRYCLTNRLTISLLQISTRDRPHKRPHSVPYVEYCYLFFYTMQVQYCYRLCIFETLAIVSLGINIFFQLDFEMVGKNLL